MAKKTDKARSQWVVNSAVFYTQKRGNEVRHYEDAFALDGVEHVQIEGVATAEDCIAQINPGESRWRCALADGSSQGGFSKPWAQMLVDHFIWNDESERGDPDFDPHLVGVSDWLKRMSRDWTTRKIPEILSVAPQGSPKYSRMQRSLYEEGQAATLAMLELDFGQHTWRAGALGDAFIFHMDTNGLLQPVRPARDIRANQLDTHPILISTKETNQDAWIWTNTLFDRDAAFADSTFNVNDHFLLMTDALAKWFLRVIVENDDKDEAWREMNGLLLLRNNAAYLNWVNERRDKDKTHKLYLGNDDTTLIHLYISTSDEHIRTIDPIPVRRQIMPKPASAPSVLVESIPTSGVYPPIIAQPTESTVLPATDTGSEVVYIEPPLPQTNLSASDPQVSEATQLMSAVHMPSPSTLPPLTALPPSVPTPRSNPPMSPAPSFDLAFDDIMSDPTILPKTSGTPSTSKNTLLPSSTSAKPHPVVTSTPNRPPVTPIAAPRPHNTDPVALLATMPPKDILDHWEKLILEISTKKPDEVIVYSYFNRSLDTQKERLLEYVERFASRREFFNTLIAYVNHDLTLNNVYAIVFIRAEYDNVKQNLLIAKQNVNSKESNDIYGSCVKVLKLPIEDLNVWTNNMNKQDRNIRHWRRNLLSVMREFRENKIDLNTLRDAVNRTLW